MCVDLETKDGLPEGVRHVLADSTMKRGKNEGNGTEDEGKGSTDTDLCGVGDSSDISWYRLGDDRGAVTREVLDDNTNKRDDDRRVERYEGRRKRDQRKGEDDEYEGTGDEHDKEQRNEEKKGEQDEDKDDNESDRDIYFDAHGAKKIQRHSRYYGTNKDKREDRDERTTERSTKEDDTNDIWNILEWIMVMYLSTLAIGIYALDYNPPLIQWIQDAFMENKLLDRIIEPILQCIHTTSTADFKTTYFYYQPAMMYWTIPWIVQLLSTRMTKLSIPNNWTKQIAFAYSLKGNKSLRFTDEMGCDTGHQIYKPILLYWILQWILLWIIKSLFNGLKHLSLLNWATQEVAYTYSFDEATNMRFMFDSRPTRHCVGNKICMTEFKHYTLGHKSYKPGRHKCYEQSTETQFC